ncbi:uncharacterized protein PAM68-like [Silene latifolia]|uniref:uncharacterized protein PAM68-like n=1 Tax=Silene latifolia TaxID=37657 RepID=UPI003D779F95
MEITCTIQRVWTNTKQQQNNNKSMQKKENNASKPSSNKQEEKFDDDDDKIPQVVFDRMVRRIVTSVGVPLAIGVVFLKLFDILQERHLLKVPLWIPFVTTFVFFGSSALGVVYGSLSTSWDAEKEGSILGLDEAKVNWVEMWKEEDAN